jgi:hypothetical protein
MRARAVADCAVYLADVGMVSEHRNAHELLSIPRFVRQLFNDAVSTAQISSIVETNFMELIRS